MPDVTVHHCFAKAKICHGNPERPKGSLHSVPIQEHTFSSLQNFLPESAGKEKAHKHKQIFSVTARAGGGFSRPVARGQKLMCCVRNPRNINVFVQVPGREESGSRPGGSVTGVTEKLFMCQMFMCLFLPLRVCWKFGALDFLNSPCPFSQRFHL